MSQKDNWHILHIIFLFCCFFVNTENNRVNYRGSYRRSPSPYYSRRRSRYDRSRSRSYSPRKYNLLFNLRCNISCLHGYVSHPCITLNTRWLCKHIYKTANYLAKYSYFHNLLHNRVYCNVVSLHLFILPNTTRKYYMKKNFACFKTFIFLEKDTISHHLALLWPGILLCHIC